LEVRWSSRRKSAEKQLQLKKNLANSQVKVLASLYNKYTTQLSCSSAKKQKKKKVKKLTENNYEDSKMPVDICSQPHNLLSSMR